MIVQIESIAVKTIVSGHVFTDDCPDSFVNYNADAEIMHEVDDKSESGHRTYVFDINSVVPTSGHISGHVH